MTFEINGRIKNADNAEMLATLTYLKDTFPSKISSASGNGQNKEVQFQIVEDTFTVAIASITALIAQYGDGENDRMHHWQIQFRDYVGL